MRRLILILGLALTSACGGDDTPSSLDADATSTPDTATDVGPPDTFADTTGPDVEPAPLVGTTFAYEPGADAFVLRHDGAARLSFPLSSFSFGAVPALDETLNYDPYYLEDGASLSALYSPPEDLVWVAVNGVMTAESAGEDTVFTLGLDDGREATLRVSLPGDGRVRFHWTPPSDGAPVVFFRLEAGIDATEGLYGLGEVFDHVNHRGQLRAMQIEPAELESGYNEVHVPVPFLTGTTGWGFFVESMRPGVFACATDVDNRVRVTFGLGADGAEGLVAHLFTADHPLDIAGRYYDVTGRPGLIAEWAMGPWIWRDEVAGQDAVEEDLATIRELDLATTGYWIDRPYASAVNSFDFEPTAYSDPAAMMQIAKDLGFVMALWHTPYVDPEDADSAPLYAEAEAAGYFAPVGSTALAKWGPPVDFTNPEAMTWWRGLLQPYVDLGVVGYKLDYGEEVIVGAFGSRFPWRFHDDSDELTMHRRYQLLYHETYAALLPEAGGFLLCRAAMYGEQTQGVIIWPGDIDATLSQHGEAVITDDGSYISVGGLHAAVVAGSSLGVSGFPFFGSDTGGYRNAPPNRETYIRWFQHTALSTVMQVGTNANDLPWSFGADKVLDQEMLDLYRVFARLHLRLHPYLWTFVAELQTTGRAIQRPLGLAYPELGWHGDDIYLLGDHLLVAPVTRAGITEREIPLPAGEWIDWWTGERIAGGETVVRPAPLETLPLLVRAGVPIPLLRDDVDTLSPVTDSDIVSVSASNPGPLHVLCSAGPAATFELHDGTVLTQSPTEDGLRFTCDRGSRYVGEVVLEIVGLGVAPTVVDDIAASWSVERGGTLTITLGSDIHNVTIVR